MISQGNCTNRESIAIYYKEHRLFMSHTLFIFLSCQRMKSPLYNTETCHWDKLYLTQKFHLQIRLFHPQYCYPTGHV